MTDRTSGCCVGPVPTWCEASAGGVLFGFALVGEVFGERYVCLGAGREPGIPGVARRELDHAASAGAAGFIAVSTARLLLSFAKVEAVPPHPP